MTKLWPAITLVAALFLAPTLGRAAEEAHYEYRVMSLMQMYEGTPEAQKVREIVPRVTNGIGRTDMDAVDYEKALNRIAAEGWELVTVNKSNYWVFRRSAKPVGQSLK